jgi:hypothetical protein
MADDTESRYGAMERPRARDVETRCHRCAPAAHAHRAGLAGGARAQVITDAAVECWRAHRRIPDTGVARLDLGRSITPVAIHAVVVETCSGSQRAAPPTADSVERTRRRVRPTYCRSARSAAKSSLIHAVGPAHRIAGSRSHRCSDGAGKRNAAQRDGERASGLRNRCDRLGPYAEVPPPVQIDSYRDVRQRDQRRKQRDDPSHGVSSQRRR